MSYDNHKNFALSAVVTPPTPAAGGTQLTVASGQGVRFPAPPFNVTVQPALTLPTVDNAEILRVTAIVGDVFTVVRAQEGTFARTILPGDQIAATITAKTITDVESANSPISAGGGLVLAGGVMSVDQAYGFTWAGVHNWRQDALGASTSTALRLENTTAATSGAKQQSSPALEFFGGNWSATFGNAQTVKSRVWLQPLTPSFNGFDAALMIDFWNGSTWTNAFEFSAGGYMALSGLSNLAGTPGFLKISNDGSGTFSVDAATYAPQGLATASGLTLSTSRLLGRTTAATGAIEEISVGTGLSLSAGSLSCTVTAPTGANPTASLGLTAVNGSAATFLRSDGAPALSVSIAPTWTALHTWTSTALGTAITSRLKLQNTTAATGGAQQQNSPAVEWTGNGWDGAASSAVTFRAVVKPDAGTGSGAWNLTANTENTGSEQIVLKVNDFGDLTASRGIFSNGASAIIFSSTGLMIAGLVNGEPITVSMDDTILTGARTLKFAFATDANATLTIAGATSKINQDVSSTGTPVHTSLALGGASVSGSTQLVFAGGTTSISCARFTTGVAPTSPVDGDTWYDGKSLYFYGNSESQPLASQKHAPYIAVLKAATVLTAGSPADIGSIALPSWITKYRMCLGTSANAGGMACYADTASGTLASATFVARDTASGGGTALTSNANGPTAANLSTAAAPNGALTVFTSSTIYINQTFNSANAGTCSFYVIIFPMI